jgi:hypothetical protein
LETRFEVASKEAGLGIEERNVQFLALVYVSDGALGVYGGSMNVVVTPSGQRYDMAREPVEARTILPSGILLAGGEGGACTSRLSDMDCLYGCFIACRRVLLRTVCCLLCLEASLQEYGSSQMR